MGPLHECRGERRVVCAHGSRPCLRFNGASARMQRRAVPATAERRPTHRELQWGLCTNAEERSPRPRACAYRAAASMGPLHECRGERVSELIDQSTASVASMGPLHECRGESYKVSVLEGMFVLLQWGLCTNAEERCGEH